MEKRRIEQPITIIGSFLNTNCILQFQTDCCFLAIKLRRYRYRRRTGDWPLATGYC